MTEPLKRMAPAAHQDHSKASIAEPILPAGYDNLADFICHNPLAWRIYLMGYESGGAAAYADADAKREHMADLVARRQRALAYLDTEVRQVAKSTAEFVDVHKARQAPGSAYVPRKAAA